MTDKSIIWVCKTCGIIDVDPNDPLNDGLPIDCSCRGIIIPYIPKQYLDVAEAETNYFQNELEKVRSTHTEAVKLLEQSTEIIKEFRRVMDGCRCGGYDVDLQKEYCKTDGAYKTSDQFLTAYEAWRKKDD